MPNNAGSTGKSIRNWWNGFPKELQQKFMKKFFPEEMKLNVDADKVFNELPGEMRLWFYECMRRNYWDEFKKGAGNLVKEKKWTAIKIRRSTAEETVIGKFYGRQNALNVLSKEMSGDPKGEYKYLIESKF